MRLSLLRLGLAGAIAGGCLVTAPVSAATSAAGVPPGFTSNVANVNGVRLHFVSGGAGSALILIHGLSAGLDRISRHHAEIGQAIHGDGVGSARHWTIEHRKRRL